MMVLSAIPNVEITCSDSCECYDDNKSYLRMKKAEIRRFLAIYFEASMNGDQMPDADGVQFYEVDDGEETED